MKKPYDTKWSVAVRVDNVTPAHVRFSVFSNLIPVEQEHEQATRALASLVGGMRLRVEGFRPFLQRLNPDVVTTSGALFLDDEFRETVAKLQEYTGVSLPWSPDRRLEQLSWWLKLRDYLSERIQHYAKDSAYSMIASSTLDSVRRRMDSIERGE